MSIQIREQPLPGIGHRYDIGLGRNQHLTVIVRRDGGREVGIGSDDADAPDASAALDQAQAVAVAAILAGARFSITTDDPRAESDAVRVETVILTENSPAIGYVAADIPLLHNSDASVLAVIRDETPELLEDVSRQPCRPGDRVVVAARQARLSDVAEDLAG